MEARYAFRKSQLLDECQIAPAIFEQVIPRLYTFMKPFVKTFHGQVADQHAKTSVCGLLSDVERTNIASMASRFGPSRLPLQGFIGWDTWDDEPWRHALIDHVKTHLGQADGVLVCDPAGFPKSGRESVGVATGWRARRYSQGRTIKGLWGRGERAVSEMYTEGVRVEARQLKVILAKTLDTYSIK